MTESILFDDTFTISSVLKEKYDRVSRIHGPNRDGDIHLALDINSELFPLSEGERINVVIASTLAVDGSKETAQQRAGWRGAMPGGVEEASLADSFDYVCHGKVYKFEGAAGDKIQMFASFGGLLLRLEGANKKLIGLKHDYIYLLIKA